MTLELPEGKAYGLLERAQPIGTYYPAASIEAIPPLSSAEWVDMPDVRYLERWAWDLDQNGYNACTCFGLAHALTFTLARMDSDVMPPKLDALAFYQRWNTRGGVALDAAMNEAMTKGYPIVGGGKVIITEAYDAADIQSLGSAWQRGYFAIFGHGGRRTGHCECGLSLRKNNAAWMIDTRNSWARSWGERGFHSFALGDVALEMFGCGIITDARVEK